MSLEALRPRSPGRERRRDPRGARRQPVPLHRLRGDRRGRAQRVASGRVSAPYPRFSGAEMARRRGAIERVMAEREVDFLLLYGANRSGPAVGWLTRWPVTREAYVVVAPGERDLLFVDFYNHVPNAQRIATEADVRACAARGIELPLAALRERGAAGKRIGVIGALPWRAAAQLAGLAGGLVDARRRLHPAAARQVRGGARLAAHRVRADRPRASRRSAPARARDRRARARRAGRGRLPRRRRHDPHPLLRSRPDGPGRDRRARRSGRPRAGWRPATRSCARSAPPGGTIPVRCCGRSPSRPSRRRCTASSTPSPTRPSTRSWRACAPVRRPPSSSRRRA